MPLKPLILLTGPDGSGKTTISHGLRALFETQGVKVRIVRLRGTHTLAYVLMRFMRDVTGLRGTELHYFGLRIPKGLRSLWIYIETVSVLPLVFLYYYLLRIRYLIISERSLLDVIIWILTGVNETPSKLLSVKALKFLLLLAFKFKNYTIYVTASKSTLISRKATERSLIIKMKDYYDLLANRLSLTTIDTSTCSTTECLKRVLSIIYTIYR